jgi:hypothetical protein
MGSLSEPIGVMTTGVKRLSSGFKLAIGLSSDFFVQPKAISESRTTEKNDRPLRSLRDGEFNP